MDNRVQPLIYFNFFAKLHEKSLTFVHLNKITDKE